MKPLFKTLFAGIYTISYFFLALLAAGGGHGTYVFFAPLFTWIFLLAAIFLSSRAGNLPVKVVFLVLMALHYIQVLYFIILGFAEESNPYTIKFGSIFLLTFFFIAAWYFAGQVIIWAMFFKAMRNHENMPESDTSFLK